MEIFVKNLLEKHNWGFETSFYAPVTRHQYSHQTDFTLREKRINLECSIHDTHSLTSQAM